MFTLLAGFCLCCLMCIVLFKSITFDPEFDRIHNNPYMTSNKGKTFQVTSCSAPVPTSIVKAKKDYKFDYSIRF